MRRIILAMAVLALMVPLKMLAQAGPEKELLNLERIWADAFKKSDAAAIDAILAPNWSLIGGDGKVVTRAQYLDDVRKYKVTKLEVSELKATLLAPTVGMVTGVWTIAGTDPKGEKFDNSERWTDVFVKQDGKWKGVAGQGTTIKK